MGAVVQLRLSAKGFVTRRQRPMPSNAVSRLGRVRIHNTVEDAVTRAIQKKTIAFSRLFSTARDAAPSLLD